MQKRYWWTQYPADVVPRPSVCCQGRWAYWYMATTIQVRTVCLSVQCYVTIYVWQNVPPLPSAQTRRFLGTRLPGLDFILVCGWLLKDKLVCTCKTINLHFFVWLTATAWGLMCYHLQAVLCPHTLQLLWENMIRQLVTMHMHTATVYLYLMWHK